MKQAGLENIAAGARLRIYYEKNNINNAFIEVRAIVDEIYVVHREWVPARRRWKYTIEPLHRFELLIQDGHLFCD